MTAIQFQTEIGVICMSLLSSSHLRNDKFHSLMGIL